MRLLDFRTEPGWAERALQDPGEILVEQAHLEKKAASTALTFLFRYPDHAVLQVPLSALAREELEHFERVLALLRSRGFEMRRLSPSGYAARLFEAARRREPGRLLDRLLCCGLIEARSCERLSLLQRATADTDPELSGFYADLVASEARHQHLYVRLAAEIFPPEEVEARLAVLRSHEAEVLATQPPAPRLHAR